MAFQNGAKTLKNQFLKASWNATFSAQEAPRRASGAKLRSAWRNARVAWGGLRRGKTDVQAPRRVDVRNLALEALERTIKPGSNDSARRPQLGCGSLRAFGQAILIYRLYGGLVEPMQEH